MNIDVKLTIEELRLTITVLDGIKLCPEMQTINNKFIAYHEALCILKRQEKLK